MEQLENWFNSAGKPKEVVVKARLRDLLGKPRDDTTGRQRDSPLRPKVAKPREGTVPPLPRARSSVRPVSASSTATISNSPPTATRLPSALIPIAPTRPPKSSAVVGIRARSSPESTSHTRVSRALSSKVRPFSNMLSRIAQSTRLARNRCGEPRSQMLTAGS